MKKGTMPSLAALLGLLAVAGYQNREKIGEFLHQQSGPGGGVDSVVKSATGFAASLGVPPTVIDGITDVVGRFRGAGMEEAADSWVSTGRNVAVTPAQTETALGGDLVGMLVEQTGLPKDEILKRLADVLPKAVDTMTPEGRLPTG